MTGPTQPCPEFVGVLAEGDQPAIRMPRRRCCDHRNTANANAAHAAGEPELTGSPKQVEWAFTIRADKIRECRPPT